MDVIFIAHFALFHLQEGPQEVEILKNIIDDARGLINMGVKELVLTGINWWHISK